MKMKLLASSLLMAGAMMASGSASALTFASGTVNQWLDPVTYGYLTLFGGATQVGNTVTDADGDLTLAFNQLSGDLIGKGNSIDVDLSEIEVLGDDLYTVSFDFDKLNGGDGYNGNGGDLGYTLTTINTDERIASARLDSDVAAGVGELVTKDIHDVNNINPFLTLTSLNGQQDPLAGHAHFAPRQSIFVNDTLHANGSFITHVDNQFDVSVPEPMTLTLMGIGLAAFGARRRFA